MTRTFEVKTKVKRHVALLFATRLGTLVAFASTLNAATVMQPVLSCTVESLHIEGLYRTNERWFRDYVNLDLPKKMASDELVQLRSRLMTTDIFIDTAIEFKPKESSPGCTLAIAVKEKWTTIPVIRGAYGGGTPLTVVGAYETNAFGQLYAIGGEIRRYGNLAPGFFLFGKSPRAWRGNGSYGTELWLDRRRRAFFDAKGEESFGYADSEAWTGKFQILRPASYILPVSDAWQYGAHFEVVRESPTVFSGTNGETNFDLKPSDVEVPRITTNSAVVMPMLVYDQLTVDQMEMHGTRALLRAGGQFAGSTSAAASEAELFWYQRLPFGLNLATHGFAGTQGSNTLRNLYFLGGFDSVRGLPDGIHYGKRMFYGNGELRWQAAEWKFLHVQTATFFDHGAAFSDPLDAFSNRETAVGVGVRLSVPQIYRLLIRVDYGWSVGHTKSQGFSIGLGQFFQPYRLFF